MSALPTSSGQDHDADTLDNGQHEALVEPNFERREDVIRAARQLAEQAWVDSGQWNEVRINPAELGQFYGCDIYLASINPPNVPPDSPDYKNSLLRKAANSDTPVITIEQNDRPERQRFSMAHEIGHLMWYKANMTPEAFRAVPIGGVGRRARNRPQKDEDYFEDSTKQREYFADMFAHMFLLPNSIVANLVDRDITDIDMKAEAERLMVSEETLNNRLYYYCLEVADKAGLFEMEKENIKSAE